MKSIPTKWSRAYGSIAYAQLLTHTGTHSKSSVGTGHIVTMDFNPWYFVMVSFYGRRKHRPYAREKRHRHDGLWGHKPWLTRKCGVELIASKNNGRVQNN
nr:hypothetical protein [Bacteroidota bacterium]